MLDDNIQVFDCRINNLFEQISFSLQLAAFSYELTFRPNRLNDATDSADPVTQL